MLLAPSLPAEAAGRTLRVPAEYATPADAIAASTPGDVILLAPGTYDGDVEVGEDHPGITIRGEDRNTVVFDGGDVRRNAIDVEADDVTLENLTAHNFVENGFYWAGVDGFAGRYLTVWNVALYGIYAIESRSGIIEHSFVSGAADAAFYIGECNPCDTTVSNVMAILSAVGYSGTNAGGNLVIETSTWDRNGIGILPNSFDVGLEPPPQRGATFRGNTVTASGTVPTPRNTPLGGFHGVGIGVAGGDDNAIEANVVSGSTRYGIAVFTSIDRNGQWVPSGNRVVDNEVSTSGIADLALAAGSGAGNCFEANSAMTSLPAGIGTRCSTDGDGDASVADDIVRPPPELLEGLPEAPDYTTMAAPPAQPNMPPGSSNGSRGDASPGPLPLVVVVVAIGIAAVLVVAVLFVLRRSGSTPAA